MFTRRDAMSVKSITHLAIAVLLGCAMLPGYGHDIISCDSFESCPDGTAPPTNILLHMQAEIDELKALLAGVSRGTDPNTGKDTLQFSNMNVQIVSGSGITNRIGNGMGNLIIGYNELRQNGNDRNGSHMLVIGRELNYTAESFGGMVVGLQSQTSDSYASVSGGQSNTASGSFASINGGQSNTASGSFASINGGKYNTASAFGSSVSGGYSNTASGVHASVSGGHGNSASGAFASVSGGLRNEASFDQASVSGGYGNVASGAKSSVSGGHNNTASEQQTSILGGYEKTAATHTCVVGDNGIDC
jgi:hypothetical protein